MITIKTAPITTPAVMAPLFTEFPDPLPEFPPRIIPALPDDVKNMPKM